MQSELDQESLRLAVVSPDAIEEYERCRDVLLREVNRLVSEHAGIDGLIGHNPRQMMYDNHLNHAKFMANVFKVGNYQLLVRIVPSIYRAYHSHGFSFTYFTVHLQAWIDAMKAILSSSASEQLRSVYEWLLGKHEQWIAEAEADSYVSVPAGLGWHVEADPFCTALVRGQSAEGLRIATDFTRNPADLPKLYLQILQPSMYRIGKMWETGVISVAQEHLATSIVSRIMASIYQRIAPPQRTKGKALVTTTPHEHHEIGARMVADLLELDGWEVTYLGANTPSSDILAMAEREVPDLVAISTSIPFNLDTAKALCSAIRSSTRIPRTRLMVGGLAFSSLPELWQFVGADGYAPDACEAVSLAHAWWQQSAGAHI